MAVPEGPTDKRYTGNGVTKIFTIPFLLLAATDLDVYIDGIEISSGFAITNVGNPTSTITFTVAPVDQADIYLQLNVPFERLNDYQENGDFLSSTVNRDFDRIWQALKQLFRWSTRSLRLGNFDVDGAGWYRAKGNGIRDLKDPVDPQDAVTRKWSLVFLGDLISAIQGPINNALNIFYRAPDLTAHVVQDLSGADGASLIGDGTGSVKDTTNALVWRDVELQDDIDVAKLLADTGNFGKNIMLAKARARIDAGAPFMHVLGDSISHGAFADDWYRNGWVNLFKRMLNVELGTYSYGVTPLLPFTNPVTGASNADIHDVLIGAYWFLYDALTDVPTGASYVTATASAQIDITVPTFQDVAVIYYAQNPSGGSFEVLINGTPLTTINTNAATRNPFVGYGFVLTDNGLGSCKITIRTTSTAEVEITGIGYYKTANQAVLQNMSQSGRKLINTSQACVQKLMGESALFVMALGVNDLYDHQNDDVKFAAFTQVIDWLIQYANQYEVPVVVPDFVWYVGPENRTRAQLRRLATQTKGVYIPFPDFFMKNSVVPNSAYLIETLNLFTNDLHPNVAGHKLIAETIAKKIGLSISSKKQVLDYHDWWFPLALNPASGVTNKSTSAPFTSAIKNQGGQTLVRLNLTGLAGAVTKGVALGFPSRAEVQFDIPVITQLTPTNAGVSQGVCIFNSAGVSVITNAQNATADHELFFSVPRS
ncbi:hypothetical protein [Pseudomonas fragi]|uniref:Uncharacterized protein n=1 Tax=Pseudomonas fragi TaxID=296 RepID=A0A9Q5AYJ9_PSEFR|nr:hypothetical protein [Pseudomonas fragi]NNB48884.1 hypothetical protein [Pseudomonas fragi]